MRLNTFTNYANINAIKANLDKIYISQNLRNLAPDNTKLSNVSLVFALYSADPNAKTKTNPVAVC